MKIKITKNEFGDYCLRDKSSSEGILIDLPEESIKKYQTLELEFENMEEDLESIMLLAEKDINEFELK
jgi:hypothetical protein